MRALSLTTSLIGVILATLFLVSCGSGLPTVLSRPEPVAPASDSENPKPGPGGESKTFVSGTFQSLAGNLVDLSVRSKAARVLMFSQDTCVTCREEAQAIAARHRQQGRLPQNVDFITILAGATIEDAQDWASDNQVTWIVGIDDSNELLNRYCVTRTFPCIVIETVESGIVVRTNGKLSIEQMEGVTGKWNYDLQ